MLTLQQITQNTEAVKQALVKKHFKEVHLIDEIIALNEQRKKTQTQLDEKLSRANQIAKEIGQLFAQGKKEEAETLKAETAIIKTETVTLQQALNDAEEQLKNILVTIPNTPHETVPQGRTPEENVVVRESENKVALADGAKPHWELFEQYDIVDMALGTKITGAGFPVYKGKGAKLQRSLVAFFLDSAVEAGYTEVIPPFMVNEESAFATGQLPDKEGQMYHALADNFYLIPTAEVPVTNIYRDVILNEEQLPVKLAAHSPCFRREAGSYGKDVRGLNRVHQFEKVEIVQVAHPDNSYAVLEEMVQHVEGLLKQLELPYRILRLCGGDMGFTSALTYDFEVYSAAQQRWLEVSSVSNFETYQANRLKLRFKGKEDKKTQLAHTLNGSALALPRILAALLENNQTEKGIRIPKVLVPYTKFEIID
jgi:seryl-tRNA synthetase